MRSKHVALWLSVFVVIGSAFTTPLRAQTKSAPRLAPKVYIGGGYAHISNPDAVDTLFTPSFSFLIGVGLPISTGFEIMARYQRHDFGQEDRLDALGFKDPNLRISTLGIDVKWPLAPPFSPAKPYVMLGAGRFNFKTDMTAQIAGTDENGLYFNVGGGLDVTLGPTFSVFVEGKYTIINTSNESTGITPVILGIRIL
ncbi:MAG: outer membrane beta-barrel protein [Candidatus Zixiibacteriota bacterium]